MEAQREAGQGHCERYSVPRVCLYQMPAFQQGRARCLIYPANNIAVLQMQHRFLFFSLPFLRYMVLWSYSIMGENAMSKNNKKLKGGNENDL